MIWDRWDDAMDDIRDERYELNHEIQELEERLRALGIPVPPESETPPASQEASSQSWADSAYTEEYSELLSRRARLDTLRRLLEGRDRRGTGD